MDLDIVFSYKFLVGLFSASIALAVPLLLAAIGEIFVERSGVLNMGIEGVMLISSLTAFLTTLYTKSILLGLISCMIVGALLNLFIGIMTMKLFADQAITGIVMNILALGTTGFFSKLLFKPEMVKLTTKNLANIKIPILSEIPFLGDVFFNQNIIVYIAIILVPMSCKILFRTNFGLKIRAVGGNAKAADTMGIDVLKTRYLCLIIGGALAGLAGGYLSLTLGMFVERITANKGFIALALVMFSRWNPYGALFGSLLFGLSDAFQLRLQALGFDLPYQFLLMLPYVLTIIALIITMKRNYVSPSIVGEAYIREKK